MMVIAAPRHLRTSLCAMAGNDCGYTVYQRAEASRRAAPGRAGSLTPEDTVHG